MIRRDRGHRPDRASNDRSETARSGHDGIADHSKTWRFTLRAEPEACTWAFQAAFSGGPLLKRAKWTVCGSGQGAVATYQGWAGLMKGLTMLSATASAEAAGAVGSEVQFEIESSGADGTRCAMWLGSSASKMGFTTDARFMKPYVRAVEDQLRALDPSLAVTKD